MAEPCLGRFPAQLGQCEQGLCMISPRTWLGPFRPFSLEIIQLNPTPDYESKGICWKKMAQMPGGLWDHSPTEEIKIFQVLFQPSLKKGSVSPQAVDSDVDV